MRYVQLIGSGQKPVIQSFRGGRLTGFVDGKFVRAFEPFRPQAEKRPAVFDAAASVAELRTLPSNRLEALGGDRCGQ